LVIIQSGSKIRALVFSFAIIVVFSQTQRNGSAGGGFLERFFLTKIFKSSIGTTTP